MKKKILVVALVAALIAIVVSGSLAYFTAEDRVENTFTIGSVKIEVYENGEPTPDPVKPLGKLVPVVDENPANDESYLDKVVQVKNIGANAAYVRTHIAFPTALADYLQLDMADLIQADWKVVGFTSAAVNGVDYTVITYDYQNAVAPEAFTAELLRGVYLKSNVDLKEDASGNLVFILRDAEGNELADSGFVAHTKNADDTYTSANVNILVVSEAIQTDGFSDATTALNTGFGQGKNPWQ